MKKFDIGLIGLAVMGQNLVLNMSDHGFSVAVYNRTIEKTHDFIRDRASERDIVGVESLQALVDHLERPRRIMLMIKSGKPVDQTIEALLPLLDAGDVIIDGGNSFFQDTIRRHSYLAEKGIHYIGAGVSGGEIGARRGPSIMPGGAHQAWEIVRPILQGIAAKVDGDIPCCDWMGTDGAGHYVKMVHNGIEYGFMQLIAESYAVMQHILQLSYPDMASVFKEWDQGKLNSYLVEITGDILAFQDADGSPLVRNILDAAGQKGTGRWTSESALLLGIPLTLISEAVFARALSALKEERMQVAPHFNTLPIQLVQDKGSLQMDLENALYLAEIISYAQGFMLFREAAAEYDWHLNYASIANIWRDGCIIRSALLKHIRDAFSQNPDLKNLLLAPFFQQVVTENIASLRRMVIAAVNAGVPVPAFSSALAFFDGYRADVLPANLIQAQRDFFGSHTYERTDKPRGEFFHTNWTGEGGDVTASTYTA
jgi:6-phosphogluconate dehydrogenase